MPSWASATTARWSTSPRHGTRGLRRHDGGGHALLPRRRSREAGSQGARREPVDMAAMGAMPYWAMLALTVPDVDTSGWRSSPRASSTWRRVRRHLIGGDTTQGRSTVVTDHGRSACGAALRRAARRPGNDVWVSGHAGRRGPRRGRASRAHPARSPRRWPPPPAAGAPEPRVALGPRAARDRDRDASTSRTALTATWARARTLAGRRARVELAAVPRSPALAARSSTGRSARWRSNACSPAATTTSSASPPATSDRSASRREARRAGCRSRDREDHAGPGLVVRDATGIRWPRCRGPSTTSRPQGRRCQMSAK